MFYTPTNLLAEALQGLCSKYDAHYETCSITESPNTFVGDRAAPSDDSFSKSCVGFRCVLTIASVGGLTLPMPKYAYAQQQRGGGDFVIGVGTGYSKTQAWRAAAVAALKRHFPQLLEQKNALAELSDTLTTSSLGPSIRLELGFGLGMPNFIFGSRFVRQDIASDEAPRRRFESVCRVATSSKSRSDVSPHATNDETVDGDSPSASFWFETTAETDGVAFVKAVRELQTRWKVAVAEHVQVAAAATAEQHPMFHRWDMTSNYTKSFLHAHFGALGVALKGKLRLSLNKSPQSDDDSANTMSSDVVGSDNGLAKDLCVTIEMMDEHNHLRAAVLHPNGNVLSTEASALVQSLGKSGSAKGARVLPGGTMFVELFALLRHHIRLRCDVLVRESEMPLLRDAIQGRMQTEGTSFRFSAERRVQCILRALLGLQVEVVVGNSHDDTDDDSVTESKRLLFGGSPPSVLPLYRPFRATVFVYLPIAGEAEFLALRWHEQYQRQVDRDADLTSLHRQQHAADPSQQAAWGATKNVTHKKMKKANAMKHIPIVSSRQVPPRKPKFLDHEAPERARVALFTASDESSQRAALEKLLRLTEQFTESCGVWN
ncbi:Hypothetical protein, putative [Bodo saltans]|uniref:Uncharacterized protein n=1 Tax=Bodo saltans TaxID=75058 RepID=A0A0S4ISA0_BODSA|nr:Hypothetical protein, putative [Bodo saltans]|eukprot:CUF54570.1 Hypothetical protein, putative [Bodo saltans]